jgi:hypothetical protein
MQLFVRRTTMAKKIKPATKKSKKRLAKKTWRDEFGFLHIGQTIVCAANGGTPLSAFAARSS